MFSSWHLWLSLVQSLSHVRLFASPWISARQASLSITDSRSLLRLLSIESVMPSSHLILYHPLLLLLSIPPSIRVFSNESTLCMRWPKYWSFSFSIIPSILHLTAWTYLYKIYTYYSRGIEPRSPSLWADSLPAEPLGKPKNTGVGSLSFLQWIFLTQKSNWGLTHCRQILYQLSYQGSPQKITLYAKCQKTMVCRLIWSTAWFCK